MQPLRPDGLHVSPPVPRGSGSSWSPVACPSASRPPARARRTTRSSASSALPGTRSFTATESPEFPAAPPGWCPTPTTRWWCPAVGWSPRTSRTAGSCCSPRPAASWTGHAGSRAPPGSAGTTRHTNSAAPTDHARPDHGPAL